MATVCLMWGAGPAACHSSCRNLRKFRPSLALIWPKDTWSLRKAAIGITRISFQQGDACNLPFEDKSFDRAYSMLVLHFIPDSIKAVSEMRRVVRPGGTITAAVWDEYGGLPHYRMLVDIAATLDPTVERRLFLPLNGTGRNDEAVARSWNARCRADQPFDPHGIQQLRRLLATVHKGRRTAGTIGCKPVRNDARGVARSYAKGIYREPARRAAFFCMHGLGLSRNRTAIASTNQRSRWWPRMSALGHKRTTRTKAGVVGCRFAL